MERGIGVEPEREEVGVGLEQEPQQEGPAVGEQQKHASGNELEWPQLGCADSEDPEAARV
jgi:hypothetical protein